MRESEVAQSCLTLSNPMDCSLPGSSFHGIFQARVLEWDVEVNPILEVREWDQSDHGFMFSQECGGYLKLFKIFS